MSKFKRAAVAAAAMMVLSPLAACGGGGGGASAGGPRIGVTVYGEGNLVKEGKEGKVRPAGKSVRGSGEKLAEAGTL